MSDFAQNRPPHVEADDWDGLEGDQDIWDSAQLGEHLGVPPYQPEVEVAVIHDTREMLVGVAARVSERSLHAPEMGEYVSRAIAALEGLRPSDIIDPDECYRDDKGSAFNQAAVLVAGLLNQFTEAWGYGERAKLQANEPQRLRYLVIAKMLAHLEERFGLARMAPAVGDTVDSGTMLTLAEVPAELTGQQVGTVARLIHIGFCHNDGTVWRPADVHRYIDAQAHADRFALEHYHVR
jgi:hypothetical protein